MITTNIDLNDRLVNGLFGTVYDFGFINSSIIRVYLKLDDKNAGKKSNVERFICIRSSSTVNSNG